MTDFSETLMEHFQSPHNRRRLENANVTGEVGNPNQGLFLRLFLQVERGHVIESGYECNGCGVTVACGSALTELIAGKSLVDCTEITKEKLVSHLDGVPPHKLYCAEMAVTALHNAVANSRCHLELRN